MNARTPQDPRRLPNLSDIRPSAELNHPPSSRAQRVSQQSSRNGRPRLRPSRQRRHGWSLLGRIAAGVVGLVLLAGAAIAGMLYVYSPAELVRTQLIRQVKANTGRDLQISGESRVVFYPNIGVSFGNVVLSGPPGMAGGPTLDAERIDVSVALVPLFSQNVSVQHIAIVRPVIELHVDKAGRQSWQFADHTLKSARLAHLGGGLGTLTDALPVRGQAGIPVALPLATDTSLLDKLELKSVALTDASVRYHDERTGAKERVDDLDLRLTGGRIADPISANGKLVWQGEPLKFNVHLDTISKVLAGRAANARVTVSGQPVSAGFDGTVKLDNELKLKGQTRLSGNSFAKTASWLGMRLPNAAPLGGFQVSGRVVGSPQSVALNGAVLQLGSTKASGVILVAFRPKRPYLSADLKMSEVDIDRLSAGFAGAEAVPRSQVSIGRTQPSGSPAKMPAPQSIDDLLRRSQQPGEPRGAGRFAPQVRGYTNRNEWSAEPIDAAALGLLDAKARLRIDGLKVSGLSIGRTVLRLALTDSNARVDIDDIQLYGGSGKGVLTAGPDTRAGGIGIGANIRVDKVSARPLLKDAAGFDRLDGAGELVAVLSGSGASQRALAHSLNGTARFAFQDGAIVGWNIAKIMRGAQRGQFSNLDATPAEQTDFSELAASFKIAGGVATTSDLRMISPLLRLAGDGTVGIGARNLSLALRPRLVASFRGQGAGAGGSGLEIPIRLQGPWHDPQIALDFNSLAKDPNQIIDQAKKLGQQFKGKSVGDIVRGVLGNDNGERRQPNVPERSGSSSGDLLRQFLPR